MAKVIIATRYEYDLIDSPGVVFDPKDPLSRSRTLQSGKDEADINKIMARYEKTGVLGTPLDDISGRIPQFGDFSDIGDYHSVMIKLAGAQRNFMLLPAHVRAKFDHDVAKLLDFVADPKNVKEAVELGILDKSMLPPVPQVPPVEVSKPAVPAPEKPAEPANPSGGVQ